MRFPEAPEIDGFRPIGNESVMGTGFVVLRSAEGIELKMTSEGVNRADDPVFNALLQRMGHLIAKNDGYRDVYAIRAAEPAAILRVSNPDGWGNKGPSYASVYAPEASPRTILKAFDFDPIAASVQFYFMSRLHKSMRNQPVQTPQQFALFSSHKSKHKTVVMERVPGVALDRKLAEPTGTSKGRDQWATTYTAAMRFVKSSIRAATTGFRHLTLNDLNTNNIIVDGQQELSVDNIENQHFYVIDQPKMSLIAKPLGRVMVKTAAIKNLFFS